MDGCEACTRARVALRDSVRLWLIAEGKLKQRAARELADDYVQRIRRYARFDEVEVKDQKALGRALPTGARVIALCVDGEALQSEQFAHRLERWSTSGKGEIAFVVGGADGLPQALVRSAHHRLSLSSMTLPHRLARIVLLEQLYRAFSIQRGEPYAREG